MTLRLVQRGRPPLVLAYLVGPALDGALRAVLPDHAIVATTDAAASPTDLAVAFATAGLPKSERVYLVGYSRGCQAVRSHLMRGVEVVGATTIDGTHASLPPQQWQLDVWTNLAAEARSGRRQWVATCTQMSYVEQIPIGEPGRALSTRHLLERATGVELPAGHQVHDGALHVLSFPSRTVDHDAHVRQLCDVLPLVLHRHVAPWLTTSGQCERWRDPELSLGARCLAWSLAHLGVTEDPIASNTGPRIREWLAPCERDGKPLNLTCGEWCAAFVCAAQAAALLDHEAVQHPYVASGIELERHFQSTGQWLSAADARAGRGTPSPGDIMVLRRGPPGTWKRHVCRVATPVDHGRFTTIGGNEDHSVRLVARRMNDDALLGFGIVRPAEHHRQTPSGKSP